MAKKKKKGNFDVDADVGSGGGGKGDVCVALFANFYPIPTEFRGRGVHAGR